MKKLIILLLLFICFKSFGQTPVSPVGPVPTAYYHDTSDGSTWINQNTAPYNFGWLKFRSGGGGTTTNPLSLTYGFTGQPLSFNGSAAITGKIDTSLLQTVLNFFPKGDTRWLRPTGNGSGLTNFTSSQITTALGFTPENVANKTATASTSTTTYPNWLGVENYVLSGPVIINQNIVAQPANFILKGKGTFIDNVSTGRVLVVIDSSRVYINQGGNILTLTNNILFQNGSGNGGLETVLGASYTASKHSSSITTYSISYPNDTTGVSNTVIAGNNPVLYSTPLSTKASTISKAGFSIIPGVAPTSPVNGNMWLTTSHLYAQINGSTIQVDGGGGGITAGYGLSGTTTFIADTTVLKSKAGFNTDYNNLSGRITTNTTNIATNTSSIATKQSTLSGIGNVYSASGAITYRTAVRNEIPSGSVNGINTIFTATNTPITGTYELFYNGQLLRPTTDYTLSGSTITTTFAPSSSSGSGSLLENYSY